MPPLTRGAQTITDKTADDDIDEVGSVGGVHERDRPYIPNEDASGPSGGGETTTDPPDTPAVAENGPQNHTEGETHPLSVPVSESAHHESQTDLQDSASESHAQREYDFICNMVRFKKVLNATNRRFEQFSEYLNAYDRYATVMAASFKAAYVSPPGYTNTHKKKNSEEEEQENEEFFSEPGGGVNEIPTTPYTPTEAEMLAYDEQEEIFNVIRFEAKLICKSLTALRRLTLSVLHLKEFDLVVPTTWLQKMVRIKNVIEQRCDDILKEVDNREEYETMQELFAGMSYAYESTAKPDLN
jgi:hypothetical protein